VVPFLRGSSSPPTVARQSAAQVGADRQRWWTDRSVKPESPPHKEVVAPRRR